MRFTPHLNDGTVERYRFDLDPDDLMLPNFIIPGFAKSGTTSMHEYLRYHPQIFMSDPKEPYFFNHESPSDRVLAWYESLFDGVTTEKAVGESSTSYTTPEHCASAAQRIADQIPDCKLIFMVRDPIQRIESEWKMRVRELWEPQSRNLMETIDHHPRIVENGFYWRLLSAYRSRFSDEQILIVFLGDLIENPSRELQRCFVHLGVDDTFSPDVTLETMNPSQGRRQPFRMFRRLVQSRLSQAVKAWFPAVHGLAKRVLTKDPDVDPVWDQSVKEALIQGYRDDTRQLLEFCGKPLDMWYHG